jgi:hypothetical protein
MLVIWENKMWQLNGIPYSQFESLKKSSPGFLVEIIETGSSAYKETKTVPVGEVQDQSRFRNESALGLN